jgi:hypothetical protein
LTSWDKDAQQMDSSIEFHAIGEGRMSEVCCSRSPQQRLVRNH